MHISAYVFLGREDPIRSMAIESMPLRWFYVYVTVWLFLEVMLSAYVASLDTFLSIFVHFFPKDISFD